MGPRTPITSTHNPRFRAALALREARERRTRGLILIDGGREIARAIGAGVKLVEVWISPERLTGVAGAGALKGLESAESAGVPIMECSPVLLDRLAFGERNEGLVAVAERPRAELASVRLPDRPLVAIVEGVEKPGNLGAILRSADGAGLDALIVADPATEPWNPNAIRASLGTVFTVPLAVAASDESRAWLHEHGIRAVAARVDATLDYTDMDLTGPLAIVLGSEAEGLTPAWSGPDVTAVRIPMLGVADSLNVSATAAVLFYEARRQRGPAGVNPARART
jgi:TrmH family RNA methyltransferase